MIAALREVNVKPLIYVHPYWRPGHLYTNVSHYAAPTIREAINQPELCGTPNLELRKSRGRPKLLRRMRTYHEPGYVPQVPQAATDDTAKETDFKFTCDNCQKKFRFSSKYQHHLATKAYRNKTCHKIRLRETGTPHIEHDGAIPALLNARTADGGDMIELDCDTDAEILYDRYTDLLTMQEIKGKHVHDRKVAPTVNPENNSVHSNNQHNSSNNNATNNTINQVNLLNNDNDNDNDNDNRNANGNANENANGNANGNGNENTTAGLEDSDDETTIQLPDNSIYTYIGHIYHTSKRRNLNNLRFRRNSNRNVIDPNDDDSESAKSITIPGWPVPKIPNVDEFI